MVNMVDERTYLRGAPLGLVINSQPSWSAGQWSLDSGETEPQAGRRAAGAFVLWAWWTICAWSRADLNADSYLIKEKIRLINAGDRIILSVRVSYTVASSATRPAAI